MSLTHAPKGTLEPGAISPIRSVPAQIERPEYVGKDREARFTGSEVKDAETVERIREATRIRSTVSASLTSEPVNRASRSLPTYSGRSICAGTLLIGLIVPGSSVPCGACVSDMPGSLRKRGSRPEESHGPDQPPGHGRAGPGVLGEPSHRRGGAGPAEPRGGPDGPVPHARGRPAGVRHGGPAQRGLGRGRPSLERRPLVSGVRPRRAVRRRPYSAKP